MGHLAEQAKIKSVMYDAGYFPDAEKTRKFVKAPFDIVLMQNADDGVYSSYIMPISINISDNYAGATQVDRGAIGYIADQMVIPASNLGDHEGHPSDWRGCFRLGMI